MSAVRCQHLKVTLVWTLVAACDNIAPFAVAGVGTGERLVLSPSTHSAGSGQASLRVNSGEGQTFSVDEIEE